MNTHQGSIWRKWDMHVHSPASFGGDDADYEQFRQNLAKSEAAVVGINDYCTIDGYARLMEMGGIDNTVLLPVVEFRMNNTVAHKHSPIAKSGTRINFHIIFNNAPHLTKRIRTWLLSLECFYEGGDRDRLGNVDAADYGLISFNYLDVIESLKKSAQLSKHFLVWLPYNEYGGVDNIDPIHDGYFKLGLINNADLIGSSSQSVIDFFTWKHFRYEETDFKKWFPKKPCIKGSDAHEMDYPFGQLRDKGSQPMERYCWIKADPTFEGLKQVIHEPESRVYIGLMPEALRRVQENKTKYIKKIELQKVANSSLQEDWFNNVSIDLNPELVAIIGNKGNGKSALLDIIGLLGNTKNARYFSFLKDNRFKKQNKAKNFEAKLQWHSNDCDTCNLNDIPLDYAIEKVKYIPQDFLEKLCNEKEEEFEQELKQVIFSHVPEANRLGKGNLDDLIQYKNEITNQEIRQIQNELQVINQEIISLEKKRHPNYVKLIKEQLKNQDAALKTHLKNKPKAIHAPTDITTNASQVIAQQISEQRKKMLTLQNSIQEKTDAKIAVNQKIVTLQHFLQSMQHFNKQHQKLQDKYQHSLQELHINLAKVVQVNIQTKLVEEKLTALEKQLINLNKLLGATCPESLPNQLITIQNNIGNLQKKLDGPSQAYQQYISLLKKWEEKYEELLGTPTQEGSLQYYETQIRYLENDLDLIITKKRKERQLKIKQLFTKKTQILSVYKKLYEPVTQFINSYKDLNKNYQIQLEVSLQIKGFAEQFFTYLNRNVAGSFCGIENSTQQLKNLLQDIDFNNYEQVAYFLDRIITMLETDVRTGQNNKNRIIEKQIKQKFYDEFYQFLFSLNYLEPTYKLQLGNKDISELSPGERGALLLIFYLILDQDDIPLIIDQPEENLDNQSVYQILVPFIQQAKKRRQIIIVTHNPNLAVVCDAEQIVQSKIDKANGNKVSLISGAIENPQINRSIIEVLEGTMPAFNLRSAKYAQSQSS